MRELMARLHLVHLPPAHPSRQAHQPHPSRQVRPLRPPHPHLHSLPPWASRFKIVPTPTASRYSSPSTPTTMGTTTGSLLHLISMTLLHPTGSGKDGRLLCSEILLPELGADGTSIAQTRLSALHSSGSTRILGLLVRHLPGSSLRVVKFGARLLWYVIPLNIIQILVSFPHCTSTHS